MRQVHTDYSLQSYNTFQIESTAGYFSEPSNPEELSFLAGYADQRDLEILVIGEGSNLLFRKGFGGLVLHPLMDGINIIDESESELLVRVGAAVNWDNFVATCVENEWFGPENLSHIPGSVGSAPVQNVGAYGREAKDVIEYVEVFDMRSGEITILSNQECQFGYRDSIFKHGNANHFVVMYVVFKLQKKAELLLNYGNVKERFEYKETHKLSTLRETIIEIRNEKLPDPSAIGNAGSFFKNPVIDLSQFNNISNDFSQVPHYPSGNDSVKVPAAWLIDQCGWKGKKEGNVGCWPDQPLVIVNYGQATGEEIYQFSEKIAASVFDKFGISLEREVKVIS